MLASFPDLLSEGEGTSFVTLPRSKGLGTRLGICIISLAHHLYCTYLYRYTCTGTYAELPVKEMPAKSEESVTVSPNRGPGAGTKFMTPGGTPASLNILNMVQLESIAVSDGFHTVALPIRVGVAPRLAPMAVKLKGEMEAMNPSRLR